MNESPERALWTAAIFRAIQDLCISPNTSRKSDVWLFCSQAERWIGEFPSRAFTECCHNAGVDVQATHRRLREIVAMPQAERHAYYRNLTLPKEDAA